MDSEIGSVPEVDGVAHRKLLVAMLHTLAGPTAFDHLYQLAEEQPTEFI